MTKPKLWDKGFYPYSSKQFFNSYCFLYSDGYYGPVCYKRISH